MEILQEDNGKNGRFYLEQNRIKVAEMTYNYAGEDK